MCCFSRPIEHVSSTRIYARAAGEKQLLAYGMQLAAREEVAMILPLPVSPNVSDDAVRFIDLEGYPDLFEDLARGFPEVTLDLLSAEPSRFAPQSAKPLVVHDVGNFEASFVPRARDFERLDRRFRLPASALEGMSALRDHGFAVFQLRDFRSGFLGRLFGKIRTKTLHPMAFEFPRRDPSALFFPTLHVHDGELHGTAHFDHTLYCQSTEAPEGWDRSHGNASTFVDVKRAAGLIDGARECHRLVMLGDRPNADTYLRF